MDMAVIHIYMTKESIMEETGRVRKESRIPSRPRIRKFPHKQYFLFSVGLPKIELSFKRRAYQQAVTVHTGIVNIYIFLYQCGYVYASLLSQYSLMRGDFFFSLPILHIPILLFKKKHIYGSFKFMYSNHLAFRYFHFF